MRAFSSHRCFYEVNISRKCSYFFNRIVIHMQIIYSLQRKTSRMFTIVGNYYYTLTICIALNVQIVTSSSRYGALCCRHMHAYRKLTLSPRFLSSLLPLVSLSLSSYPYKT